MFMFTKIPPPEPLSRYERVRLRRVRARRARRVLGCSVACLAASVAVVFAMLGAAMQGWNVDALTMVMMLPGVITMILVRGSVRRWYRWAALWILLLTSVTAQGTVPVILFGHFWLLYVTWAVEKDAPVRGAGLFRRAPLVTM